MASEDSWSRPLLLSVSAGAAAGLVAYLSWRRIAPEVKAPMALWPKDVVIRQPEARVVAPAGGCCGGGSCSSGGCGTAAKKAVVPAVAPPTSGGCCGGGGCGSAANKMEQPAARDEQAAAQDTAAVSKIAAGISAALAAEEEMAADDEAKEAADLAAMLSRVHEAEAQFLAADEEPFDLEVEEQQCSQLHELLQRLRPAPVPTKEQVEELALLLPEYSTQMKDVSWRLQRMAELVKTSDAICELLAADDNRDLLEQLNEGEVPVELVGAVDHLKAVLHLQSKPQSGCCGGGGSCGSAAPAPSGCCGGGGPKPTGGCGSCPSQGGCSTGQGDSETPTITLASGGVIKLNT